MSARGHSSETAVMHGEFMAFVTDDHSSSVLRSWAERQGYPSATVQTGGPDMFAQMLETAAPPKLTVVDVDGQNDPVGIASRLISLCGSDNKIVVIGSANDVGLYRQFISAGVVDYLVKPLAAENLNQAMASALRHEASSKPQSKDARVVVMIGTRGGIGTSTINVNTGWILAHEHKKNCLLLDLDMQFGTSSLLLDLEPGRGLRDILSSPSRVDGLMIASSMISESDQFSVLGAEETIDEHVEIDSGAIFALLKEIKGDFDYILIDLPRFFMASQKRLLASANDIVLVTELSLAGIRDTLRMKTAITALGFAGNLQIVASRVGPSQTGHINQSAFEKGAQVKLDVVIPEDQKIVIQAANAGKAVAAMARQAAFTKALTTLVNKIDVRGTTEAPKNPRGFGQNWRAKHRKKVKPKEDHDRDSSRRQPAQPRHDDRSFKGSYYPTSAQ